MAERKSHIIRIKGKQKVEGGDPETLNDVWADVRRTDELPLDDTGDGQERVLLVAWDDDFTGDPPEDDDRIERIIKLTDPENPPDDPDDPDIYIPIPVLDQLSVFDADQKIILQFANKRVEDDGDETLREVRVKRITHADTDPAEMPDPIDAENYSRVADTVDETQYIDHEVIESSQHFDVGQEHRLIYGADDDDLMNSFEAPPEDSQNKPIRLDLLQNIVNVQFGGSNPEFFWSGIDRFPADSPGGLEGDGYVYQNSCPVEDSYSFTLSAFVKVKSPTLMNDPGDHNEYYHIFLLVPEIAGFFDQQHELPDHDFFAKWHVGINIWLENIGEDFFAINIWWGSRPVDLNPLLVSTSDHVDGENQVGFQFPALQHSALIRYQEGTSVEKTKVRDGFHLFLTIDNSISSAYETPIGDAIAAEISGPKVEIWINGEDYGFFAGPHPGSQPKQASSEYGFTKINVASPTYSAEGGIFHAGFEAFSQVTDLGIIPGDPPTPINTIENGFIPDPGAQMFAYSGLKVGFPLVGDPTQEYSAETDEFEKSIQLAKVQVWTDQIIAPSNIVPYFLTEEGKPVPVSVAQDKFGQASYVLDGPPKSFAANKRGSAGEMTLAGKIRTSNIRRSGS